jgi:hypothetical protein
MGWRFGSGRRQRASFALLVPSLVAISSAGCQRTEPPPEPRRDEARVPAAARAPHAAASQIPPPAPTGAPFTIEQDGHRVPAARALRILHVGDSMVPLVANYLRPVVEQRGGKYYVISKISSSTSTWASQRLLHEATYDYDPDLILISLGSNELFAPPSPEQVRDVRQLVKHTRGRPCLWIAPPAWKRDRGFLDLLRANLGHCRYFDSTQLDLPRMEDGRHPSWTGGYRWATAVWKTLGGTEQLPKQGAPK